MREAQPEHNGQEGVLVKFNEEKGRWETKIGSGKSAKTLELKPDNLESIDGGNKSYPEQGTHGGRRQISVKLGDEDSASGVTHLTGARTCSFRASRGHAVCKLSVRVSSEVGVTTSIVYALLRVCCHAAQSTITPSYRAPLYPPNPKYVNVKN